MYITNRRLIQQMLFLFPPRKIVCHWILVLILIRILYVQLDQRSWFSCHLSFLSISTPGYIVECKWFIFGIFDSNWYWVLVFFFWMKTEMNQFSLDWLVVIWAYRIRTTFYIYRVIAIVSDNDHSTVSSANNLRLTGSCMPFIEPRVWIICNSGEFREQYYYLD